MRNMRFITHLHQFSEVLGAFRTSDVAPSAASQAMKYKHVPYGPTPRSCPAVALVAPGGCGALVYGCWLKSIDADSAQIHPWQSIVPIVLNYIQLL